MGLGCFAKYGILNSWGLVVFLVGDSAMYSAASEVRMGQQQSVQINMDQVERLIRGTNIERQEIMLSLCLFLDEGRELPRVKEVVRVLIPLVNDRDSITRTLAVELLYRVGKEARPAIPALVRVLGDKDGSAGLIAVSVLRNLGEASIEPLVEALADKDVIVRQLSGTTLGRMGPKARKALPALIKARDAAQEDVVREKLDIAILEISRCD